MANISLNQRYILQNFLNGAAKKSDDSANLTKKTKIKESDENLISKSLEKYLKDFALGQITYKNFEVFMLGLGAVDFSQTIVNSNIVQKFTVNGKKYEITSNKEAADSGTDKIVDKSGSYLKYNELSQTNTNVFANKYNVNGKRTESIYYNNKGQITTEIKFNNDNEKIGYISYSYDYKGNVNRETVYNYDKSTNKNIMQSRYVHNADGTVAMYTFKNGKEYLLGTLKDGEYAVQNPTDPSKTTKSDYKDSNGNKIGTYEYERNANGKVTVRKRYDLEGNLTQTYSYIYDNNGKISKYFCINYKDDGSYSTTTYNAGKKAVESTSYNMDNQVISHTDYSYNEKNVKTGQNTIKYDATTGKVQSKYVYAFDNDGNKTGYTVEKYDIATGKVKSSSVYSIENGKTSGCTTTNYDLTSGKAKSSSVYEYFYDNDGNKTGYTVKTYDSATGKVKSLSVYSIENGKTSGCTTTNYDLTSGKVQSEYVYAYDNDGNKIGYNTVATYDIDTGNIKTLCKYSYDNDGNKTGYTRTDYTPSTGKAKTTTVYNLDKATNKNIPQVQYVYNTDGTVTMYTIGKDGKTKYVSGSFKEGEFAVMHTVDPSKEQTYDVKDSSGNKTGIYVDKCDSNGKIAYREWYDLAGKLTKIDNLMYDNNGTYKQINNVIFYDDGSYSTDVWKDSKTLERTTFNKNGKKINNYTYSYDAQGNRTGYTLETYDTATGKVKSSSVYSIENGKTSGCTVTNYDFVTGKVKSEYVYSYNNGKTSRSTVTNYDLASGKVKSEYAYSYNNEKTSGCTVTNYDLASGKVKSEYVYSYDKDGNRTGYIQTDYNPSTGKAKTTTVYNYDIATNKNIPQTQYVHNSNGTVTMYTFDKDGKTKYAAGTYKESEFAVMNLHDSPNVLEAELDTLLKELNDIESEYGIDGKTEQQWIDTLTDFIEHHKDLNITYEEKSNSTIELKISGKNISRTVIVDATIRSHTTRLAEIGVLGQEHLMDNLDSFTLNATGYNMGVNGETQLKAGTDFRMTGFDSIEWPTFENDMADKIYRAVSLYLSDYHEDYKQDYSNVMNVFDNVWQNIAGEYASGGKSYTVEMFIYSIRDQLQEALRDEAKFAELNKDIVIEKNESITADEASEIIKSYEESFSPKAQYSLFEEIANSYVSECDDGNVNETEFRSKLDVLAEKRRSANSLKDSYQKTFTLNSQTEYFNKQADSAIAQWCQANKGIDELENTLSKLAEDAKAKYPDGSVTYDSNGNVISETKNFYNNNGSLKYRNKINYNKDGSFTLYQYNPQTGKSIKYEFDKNGERTIERKYGFPLDYKYDFESGKITTTIFGREYDDTPQSYASLNPNVSIKKHKYGFDATLTLSDIYGMITNGPNTSMSISGFSFTLSKMLEMGFGNSLPYTRDFLYATQSDKKGPTGSSLISSYKNTKYSDFIKKDLLDSVCKNYGYEPEDIKGHKLPTSSSISQTISTDSDLKNFVKKHLSELKSGTGLPLNGTFNTNKDLYYSIHGFNIIDSEYGKDSKGEYLTLTLYDLYDFDPAYLDKVNKGSNSMNDLLNAAGAAAMNDGKLIPYFMLIEVKVYI